jgi:hypothetical protein
MPAEFGAGGAGVNPKLINEQRSKEQNRGGKNKSYCMGNGIAASQPAQQDLDARF